MAKGLNPPSRLQLRPDQVADIQSALKARGVGTACDRCTDGRLLIVPALTHLPLFLLHEAITGVQESAVPSAISICHSCGNLSLHALGSLGLKELLDKPDPGQANAAGSSDE